MSDVPDDISILSADRRQLRILNDLAKAREPVTCYLHIDSPLQYTPVVPSDELPLGFERDQRLDILHDHHRYSPGEDGYVLYVSNYRVTVPWPGDMREQSQLHSVDESGEIEEYAEYELKVERID